MSGGRDHEHSSGDDSDDSSNEGEVSRFSSHQELRGVYIDHEASYETISTLTSVAEIVIESPPPPPHIPSSKIFLDKSNIAKKLAPPRWAPKGHTKCEAAFNRERERTDNAIMEATSQNFQLNEIRVAARDYVATSQSYMKRELNKYRAQSTKMVAISAEVKSTNKNNAELKSTVKSLRVKVRAKKMEADEELKGKILELKQLAKEVKELNKLAMKEMQGKINEQKQIVKDVKEEKKELAQTYNNQLKTKDQECREWKKDAEASLAVKKKHVLELLALEKLKVKEKDDDIGRLRREKTILQKNIDDERKAKEKVVRDLHKFKERALKRKMSSDDPMEKIRYDQMRSEIRRAEHQSRLDMNAAANSNKHTVTGKSRAKAMENLQLLLQTMASGGGCHGGGHKNGAWNAGGVITALRNDMAGPLPPPMNAPFQMNSQQQYGPSLMQMQQTYAQLQPMQMQQQMQPMQQMQQLSYRTQHFQPNINQHHIQHFQPNNNQHHSQHFQPNNNQHHSQYFQPNNNQHHSQHFQPNNNQHRSQHFRINNNQHRDQQQVPNETISVASSALERNNQAQLHYQSQYEDEGEESLSVKY